MAEQAETIRSDGVAKPSQPYQMLRSLIAQRTVKSGHPACLTWDESSIPNFASPMSALIRDSMPSAATSDVITDELACLADGAVVRLCKREQQICDGIWLYYGVRHPAVRIGKRWGFIEGKVRELIKTGASWIDCVLDLMKEAA